MAKNTHMTHIEDLILIEGSAGIPKVIKFLKEMYTFYESPGTDEPNTIGIDITEDLTPQDVKNKVLEALEKHK